MRTLCENCLGYHITWNPEQGIHTMQWLTLGLAVYGICVLSMLWRLASK